MDRCKFFKEKHNRQANQKEGKKLAETHVSRIELRLPDFGYR